MGAKWMHRRHANQQVNNLQNYPKTPTNHTSENMAKRTVDKRSENGSRARVGRAQGPVEQQDPERIPTIDATRLNPDVAAKTVAKHPCPFRLAGSRA